VKKPVPALFAEASALITNLPGAALKGLVDRWRTPQLQQPEILALITEANKELLWREAR